MLEAIRKAIVLVLACGSFGATGQMLPQALNPKDYESPSHAFVLTVDPTDMYGRGEGNYLVRSNGTVVWSGKKPWTLYEAGITDKGLIAGYAYTHGIEGFSKEGRRAGEGEFHVVIMDPNGELVLDETTKRTPSHFLHTPPNPLAKGVLLDDRQENLVIVLADEDANNRNDLWWTYELSTGKTVGKSHSRPNIPLTSQVGRMSQQDTNVTLPMFPEGRLRHLGTFTLREGATNVSAIHDIVEFDFDGAGRIGILRRDRPAHCSFVHLAADGSILRETALDIPAQLFESSFPKLAWLDGNRWLIAASGRGRGAKASAWWFDATNGKCVPVVDFDCPSISRVVGSRDGGFVAIAVKHFQYSMEDVLIAFDKSGKLRWQIGEREADLLSPEDLAVTANGQIAVLDVIRHTVQFFAKDGKILQVLKPQKLLENKSKLPGSLVESKMFNLEKLGGRKPEYPCDIAADNEGGITVKDFKGKFPLVRMDSVGKVTGEMTPRDQDGRFIDFVGLKVAPSGRVWVSDAECLIRLGSNGISDLVLGSAPANQELGKIAAVTVDQGGRVFAADERTGAVHVFDENGNCERIFKPAATDFKGRMLQAQIAVSPAGRVFVSDGDSFPDVPRFVEFQTDGERVGVKRLGLDTIKEHWFPLPARGTLLVLGYHDAFLVDQNDKVTRTIQRRPDRNWLETTKDASVAPDGSFAILTGGGYWFKKPWLINQYTPDGDPIRTVNMPGECMDFCFAYAGKIMITRTDKDICLFKATGEPMLRYSPAENEFRDVQHQEWKCFSTFEGREMWFVSPGLKSVWRFATP
jgi:sugar lactone lactonase YvrE